MSKLIGVFTVAIVFLNLAAISLEIAWPPNINYKAFYLCKITMLDNMPYWVGANLLLLVFNGITLIRHSTIEYKSDSSGTVAGIPFTGFSVVGYNLLAIPFLLLLPRLGLFTLIIEV